MSEYLQNKCNFHFRFVGEGRLLAFAYLKVDVFRHKGRNFRPNLIVSIQVSTRALKVLDNSQQ